MKHILKEFFIRILIIFKPIITIQRLFKYSLIHYNKDITIGRNVFLHKDAKIENRFGGSITIGDNCQIFDGVITFTYGGNIVIGNGCNINPYTMIYGNGNVTIGSDVIIAGHVMIVSNNHNYSNLEVNIKDQGVDTKGIVIESNVWVGHGASILDGTHICSGSIIAAGAVVVGYVEPNSIYGGIPAKLIKNRN